jgi:hypothetical protein
MATLPKFIETVVAPTPPEQLEPFCWLRQAHERGAGDLIEIEGALGVVLRSGQLAGLTARARRQHPGHSAQADGRFMDVLTEACGFAWGTEVLNLALALTDDMAKPDFAVSLRVGGEAKSLHPPPGRPAEAFTSGSVIETPPDGLVRKMRAHLAKAASQLGGVSGTGAGFVFLNVLQLGNLMEDISHEQIIPALAEEVGQELAKHPSIGVVAVCWNFKWRDAVVVRA